MAATNPDRHIVDVCLSPVHQAVVGKLPQFVSAGPEPVSGIIVIFILETHRDAVAIVSPEFFDEAVVQLMDPFSCQKSFYGLTPLDKLRSIAPATILGISQRYPLIGSRLFQPFSAMRTFCVAVSLVNGDTGGLISIICLL